MLFNDAQIFDALSFSHNYFKNVNPNYITIFGFIDKIKNKSKLQLQTFLLFYVIYVTNLMEGLQENLINNQN